MATLNTTTLADDEHAVLMEFVSESQADIENIADRIPNLADANHDGKLAGEFFATLNALTVNSAFMGLMRIRRLAHAMSGLTNELHRHVIAPSPENINILRDGALELIHMLQRIRINEPEVSDPAAFEKTIELLERPQKEPSQILPAPPAPDPATISANTGQLPVVGNGHGQYIRIPERQLDIFQHFKGELIKLQKAMESAGPDPRRVLTDAAAALARITAGMEEQLAPLCAIPAGILLQKAPLVVHETAKLTGKIVRVNIDGDNIRMPAAMLEILDVPLTHLVRNAVDHGIELPSERRLAGKNEEGRLWVEVRNGTDEYTLRVADDGAGIDFKNLLAKAFAQGIYPHNRTVTASEIANLPFIPGIAGAKRASAVSGLGGMGLKAAKDRITAAGGRIHVLSKLGQGTEFTIHLPRRPGQQNINA